MSFIDNLYKLGALKVVVDQVYNEDSRMGINGGPYADALIVKLAEELEKREKLFKLINLELKPLPGFEYIDRGENELYFSWR
jgi:hypothetical protein